LPKGCWNENIPICRNIPISDTVQKRDSQPCRAAEK
jgi:hypothetical protein